MSAALGHLGNVSYHLGTDRALADISAPFGESAAGREAFSRMREHLGENDLKSDQVRLLQGPTLTFNSDRERFTGDDLGRADSLLTREYRGPFVVKETS